MRSVCLSYPQYYGNLKDFKRVLSTNIAKKDDSESEFVGFAIAGENRRFFPAKAEYFSDGTKDNRNRPVVSRNALTLSSPFVEKPVHYRYAWARNPMANVTNGRQIPLATQRSDDWMMEEIPVQHPMAADLAGKAAANYQQGKNRKELELGDTERRILEAELTISELKEKFTKDKEAWENQKAKDAEKLKAAQ